MSPFLVRHVVFPLLQWRSRGRVRPYLRQLEESQWFAPDRLRDLQWARLQGLLRHAYAHVPYYRTLFEAHGLHPGDLKEIEDLKRLPVLTKETVRDRGDELRADNIFGPFIERRTSGSTGIPLVVQVSPHTRDTWVAALYRVHRWWGLEIGARQVKLVNPHGKSPATLRKQYWLTNHGEYSVFELDEPALERLYQQVVRSRCEVLSGYPSALTFFAHYVATRNRGRGLKLKAVETTAEVLYPDMRALLQRTFGCPVVNEYGSSECGSVAGECPSGRLHIAAENVIVEFEPLPALNGGPAGYGLIVTDLHNMAMPMIRYQIGDVGAPAEPCPCGRGLPVLELHAGRIEDLVVLPDGRKVDGSVFGVVVEEAVRQGASIKQFRAIQHAPEEIEVLVATDAPNDGALCELEHSIQRMLGARLRVTVRPVTHIPVEPTGKLRRFVSHVRPPHVEGAVG